ncbi:MAG: ABC transporter ATP-binding protein [Planctomycetes bacterium]|nr:ABC transporter ATP-binding protein [Planctomycetota bacterium]MCB9871441.1 ABC transporter ATP-binding protein [Planctomycetota bacterium]MCB9888732.1 ABC transporter ATP-binding protein [Planctomycetota bacterium]
MSERLEATGVSFAYGDHPVLERVDLTVEPGRLGLLAGCNGAGKSTLMALLAGVRAPTSGEVRVGARRLADLGAAARARAIAWIPQASDTSFEFTVLEVVMMGRHPHIPRLGVPSPDDRAAVDRAMQRTDTTHLAGRSVRSLSGGELRRVHLARALATEAPVLLADEPTASLDLEHAVAILELFVALCREGRAVLVSSHDLNLVAPRCDSVALLHRRRIHRQGAPAEVLDGSTVAEVFRVRSDPPSGYFPRDFRAP